jgi:anti-sigma factor RsiW
MLRGDHIDEILVDFLYGELPEREAREVEGHLASCERCATEVERARGVRTVMARLPVAEPSSRATDVILRRARELAPQPRRWSLSVFLLRPAVAGVFTFLLVLGVGLYLARMSSDEPRAVEEPRIDRFAAAPAEPAPAAAPAATAAPSPAIAAAPRESAQAVTPERALAVKSPAETRTRRGKSKARPETPRIVAKVARPTPESLFPAKPPEAPPPPAGRKEAQTGESEVALGFMRSPGAGSGALGGASKREEATKDDLGKLQIVGRASRPEPRSDVALRALPQSTEFQRQAPSMQMPVPATAPRAAATPPPSDTAAAMNRQVMLEDARRDANEGREQDALTKLGNVATAGGREAAQALLAMAEIQLRQGDVKRAIETLERLLRTNPGYATPHAYELLASAYERRGDADRANKTRAVARRRFSQPASQSPSYAPAAKPAR